jgi:hypothetical protein
MICAPSRDGDDPTDKHLPKVDWERVKAGPSAADLCEMPATTEADWQDAELLIPIDRETYREFQAFLAKRRKKAAKG